VQQALEQQEQEPFQALEQQEQEPFQALEQEQQQEPFQVLEQELVLSWCSRSCQLPKVRQQR